ncbi:TPA: TraM recognition domain-containing protein, partial [Enterococcus faecium]|nr:TraM recognition domain-containing protein [Enterococcus faecium]
PAIDNMDGIMTVCLGRNILFDLVIQSYSQLESRYDKGAKIIKENCQNHILIMSNDDETIEEISKKCGNKTIIGKSASSKRMDTDSSVTSSADQERIITFERASQLIEGEQVILRNLHRQDKNRKKIRPFPIFNTKATNMPYRYQFLNDDFDTRKDINEIDIACDHINLSLADNQIPFASFIRDLKTRMEYSITNEILISEDDYEEYRSLPNSQQTLDEEKLIGLVKKSNFEKKSEVELSEDDFKLTTYLLDCQKHTKKLHDLMYEKDRFADDKSLDLVLKTLNERYFSSELVQEFQKGRVTAQNIKQSKKQLAGIINVLGQVYIYAENNIFKTHIIAVKNALTKLSKAI